MNECSRIATSALAIASFLMGACSYVPSSEVRIVPPPTGSFVKGDPVVTLQTGERMLGVDVAGQIIQFRP